MRGPDWCTWDEKTLSKNSYASEPYSDAVFYDVYALVYVMEHI